MYSSQDLPPIQGYRDAGSHDFGNQRGPSSAGAGSAKPVGKKPRSLGRRMLRAVSRFFLTVLLGVGGTLAWQAQGNEAKELLRTWVPALDAVLPASTVTASASNRRTETAEQQLEEITRDLVVVRTNLENLAATQEQIAFHLQLSYSAPSWAAHLLPSLAQASAKSPVARSAPAPAPTRSAQQPLALR